MCAASLPTTRLSATQARLLHLDAQGLRVAPRRKARRADVLAAIERMQVLQIDTINVVARSPYLVLYSRLGAYRAEWLDELLARGGIFEGWLHEASFAPMRDFALHRADAVHRTTHWAMRNAERVRDSHAAELDGLLARIAADGAVRSSDFERAEGTGGGGWWGWKAEKRMLEALFARGDLMIARRDHFQRVYDVAARVRETAARHGHVSDDVPADVAATRRILIGRTVRALGVCTSRWIADYFRLGRQIRDDDLAPLVADGELLRVDVTGWDAPGYVHADHAASLARAAAGKLRANRTVVLSPFDPIVWDRARAAQLFAFDYRLECYTPADKRRYGYYVLPILHDGRLIGRLDAKAHRGDGVFEVRSIHLEPDARADDATIAAIARAIVDCASWHATPRVTIALTDPPTLAAPLRRACEIAAADMSGPL